MTAVLTLSDHHARALCECLRHVETHELSLGSYTVVGQLREITKRACENNGLALDNFEAEYPPPHWELPS